MRPRSSYVEGILVHAEGLAMPFVIIRARLFLAADGRNYVLYNVIGVACFV